jgi:hypothetical protein
LFLEILYLSSFALSPFFSFLPTFASSSLPVFDLAVNLSYAQGIAAESPQDLHRQIRGLAAESPVFCGVSRKKCA